MKCRIIWNSKSCLLFEIYYQTTFIIWGNLLHPTTMVQNMITLNYANMITLNGIESISGLVHRSSHRLLVRVRQVRRPVQQQADKGDDVNNKLLSMFTTNKVVCFYWKCWCIISRKDWVIILKPENSLYFRGMKTASYEYLCWLHIDCLQLKDPTGDKVTLADATIPLGECSAKFGFKVY